MTTEQDLKAAEEYTENEAQLIYDEDFAYYDGLAVSKSFLAGIHHEREHKKLTDEEYENVAYIERAYREDSSELRHIETLLAIINRLTGEQG